jgi:hypothetical protein
VRVGVRGAAGGVCALSVAPLTAYVLFRPMVDVKGFAEAAVGIDGVVEAGAGSEITFLKDELTLEAQARVRPDPATQQLSLYTKLSAYNYMETLDGRLYIYGKIGKWPFKYKAEKTLFKWSGYSAGGTLFSEEKTTPLG